MLRFPGNLKLSYKKGMIESRLALAILLHFLAFPVRQENDMEEYGGWTGARSARTYNRVWCDL